LEMNFLISVPKLCLGHPTAGKAENMNFIILV
jgi:hypothetical protein